MPDLEQFDEKLLLKQLKNGSYEAFDRLYDQYKMRLIGSIFKLVKSDELAKDILQDLFLKVWEKRENLDVDKSFRSYLFRICENMIYDRFRGLARDQKMRQQFIQFSRASYNHVEERLVGKETALQVQEALNALPPQCKKVFILFKLEGKTYKEISTQLGISTSTVNNHLCKANQLLGTRFREYVLIYGMITLITSF